MANFSVIKTEATASFKLCADGPVLVSKGKNFKTDPTLPDNVFLMGDTGEGMAYVIPGSTVKGVIRNYVSCYAPELEESIFGIIKPSATRSKIKFNDCYADMQTIRTTVRYSTALGKLTQTAKGGTLNNMQVVTTGEFPAGFRFVNFTEQELGAVLEALAAVNTGEVCFGGRQSRGFGKMKVTDLKLTVSAGYKPDLTPKELKQYNSLDEALKQYCSKGVY